MARAVDEGVGRGGDGEHEGAGGGEGEGDDKLGGGESHGGGEAGKDGDEEGCSGGVTTELGEEDDEEDDGEDEEKGWPAARDGGELMGEESARAGAVVFEDFAQGEAPAKEEEGAPVGRAVDVGPLDEPAGTEGNDGADRDDGVEVFFDPEGIGEGFREEPGEDGEEKDDEGRDAGEGPLEFGRSDFESGGEVGLFTKVEDEEADR